MTTDPGSAAQEPVAVPQLGHGDHIHISDHDVYRHSDNPLRIGCGDADVEVDWVCYRGWAIVIVIYHNPARPTAVGSTVYDADDSVMRLEAAGVAA